MTNQIQLWPEGEVFTREVLIPTKYDPLPVQVTYTVPSFDVVVETWQNTDPEKAYVLFRQFIVDWDQQDNLTDDLLISFLVKWPGTYEVIFSGWAEHMKGILTINERFFAEYGQTIN